MCALCARWWDIVIITDISAHQRMPELFGLPPPPRLHLHSFTNATRPGRTRLKVCCVLLSIHTEAKTTGARELSWRVGIAPTIEDAVLLTPDQLDSIAEGILAPKGEQD